MTYCTTTFQKRVKRERNCLPFDTNWNHKEDVDLSRAKREFTENATMSEFAQYGFSETLKQAKDTNVDYMGSVYKRYPQRWK